MAVVTTVGVVGAIVVVLVGDRILTIALSRVILKELLNDIVLFPDHDGRYLLRRTTITIVAILGVVVIHLVCHVVV